MSAFNTEYNYNDSKIRNIIIAVVAEFQKKISYKQYTDNNTYTIITVPFFYSLTGNDDFLIDHFMSCDYTNITENKLDKNYEPVPRGVLTMTSVEIDAGSLINRHVRTTIPKKVNETEFKMYSYETIILPLNLSFDIKIVCNSNIEMFKITESLMAHMYKSNPFSVDFGGYKVKGNMNIPESFEHEKSFEFGFSDKKTNNVNFSVDVTCSIPVFDEKSEIFAGDMIQSFSNSIYDLSVAPRDELESNKGVIDPKDKEKFKLAEYHF